ncbi:MAG: CsbD family protein [Streptosporangiales bacterium]
MDADEAKKKSKGKADEVAGRAKQEAGDALDDEQMQAEGRSQEKKGQVGQAAEKIKNIFKK